MDRNQLREAATLASGEYLLRVGTRPFVCVLSDSIDRIPVWQMQAVRLRSEGGNWQHAVRADLGAVEADRLELRLAAEDGSSLACDITFAQDQLKLSLRSCSDGRAWLAVDLHARPDEHYLGLGERFDSLDQRGK